MPPERPLFESLSSSASPPSNLARRPEQRARWNVSENPAAATPKRREDPPARLEVFTVEQVEELARCAESGSWRTPRAYETPQAEPHQRDQDHQLGDLLRVAAYTRLRRGDPHPP